MTWSYRTVLGFGVGILAVGLTAWAANQNDLFRQLAAQALPNGTGACYSHSVGGNQCEDGVRLADCSDQKFFVWDNFLNRNVRDSMWVAGRTCDLKHTRFVTGHGQSIVAQVPAGYTAYQNCKESELATAVQNACTEDVRQYLVRPALIAYQGWTPNQALQQLGVTVPAPPDEPGRPAQALYRGKCGAVVECENNETPAPAVAIPPKANLPAPVPQKVVPEQPKEKPKEDKRVAWPILKTLPVKELDKKTPQEVENYLKGLMEAQPGLLSKEEVNTYLEWRKQHKNQPYKPTPADLSQVTADDLKNAGLCEVPVVPSCGWFNNNCAGLTFPPTYIPCGSQCALMGTQATMCEQGRGGICRIASYNGEQVNVCLENTSTSVTVPAPALSYTCLHASAWWMKLISRITPLKCQQQPEATSSLRTQPQFVSQPGQIAPVPGATATPTPCETIRYVPAPVTIFGGNVYQITEPCGVTPTPSVVTQPFPNFAPY